MKYIKSVTANVENGKHENVDDVIYTVALGIWDKKPMKEALEIMKDGYTVMQATKDIKKYIDGKKIKSIKETLDKLDINPSLVQRQVLRICKHFYIYHTTEDESGFNPSNSSVKQSFKNFMKNNKGNLYISNYNY